MSKESELNSLKHKIFRNNPAYGGGFTMSPCSRCGDNYCRDGLCTMCLEDDMSRIVGGALSSRFVSSVMETARICREIDNLIMD